MNREEAQQRARALVAKMTVEEKASQLNLMQKQYQDLEYRHITGGMKHCTVWREPVQQRFFHRQLV